MKTNTTKALNASNVARTSIAVAAKKTRNIDVARVIDDMSEDDWSASNSYDSREFGFSSNNSGWDC